MAETDKLDAIVSDFTRQLRAEIESQTYDRLQSAIASLRAGGSGPFGGRGGAAARSAMLLESVRPARRALSPEAARSRKLQGQYIGALRKLEGAERQQVQTAARTKGVPEGLKLATALLAKRGLSVGRARPKAAARPGGAATEGPTARPSARLAGRPGGRGGKKRAA